MEAEIAGEMQNLINSIYSGARPSSPRSDLREPVALRDAAVEAISAIQSAVPNPSPFVLADAVLAVVKRWCAGEPA